MHLSTPDLARHRADVIEKIRLGVTPEMPCAGFHGTSIEVFRKFYEKGSWPLVETSYGKPGIYFCPTDKELLFKFQCKADLPKDEADAYQTARAYAFNIQLAHRALTQLGLDIDKADYESASRLITYAVRSTSSRTADGLIRELIREDPETLKIFQSLANDITRSRKKKTTPLDVVKTIYKDLLADASHFGQIGVIFSLDKNVLQSAAFEVKPPEAGAKDEGLILTSGSTLDIRHIKGVKFLNPKDADEFLKIG